eukprot:TRINITY_DN71433_c0_g1_i1.p1 TRINITY_DN71433_c0_g1~~TRINITY_DN71433_c0_g1_i1.p1  ORF type:complete len:295 (-),score=29.48 TRINITY_DN71433_c0_g1_i1:85-969(-)
MSFVDSLMEAKGQAAGAIAFALFWMLLIEGICRPIQRYVLACEWWPGALPNQKATMVNFGYPKESITEKQAVWGFVWILTMCITHTVSSALMIPVLIAGWDGAGGTGQALFLIGTLSEVGFDIYDWLRLFLLTFVPDRVQCLGERVPLKLFLLLGGFHHSTVLALAVPMNMKYAYMPAYHWIAFSLLFSAGVCFTAGHYKLTLDATTPDGLCKCKLIVMLQFIMNYASRLFIFFPAAYYALHTFYLEGDAPYLYGGSVGMLGMGMYNIIVIMDATTAAAKWLTKKPKSKPLLAH